MLPPVAAVASEMIFIFYILFFLRKKKVLNFHFTFDDYLCCGIGCWRSLGVKAEKETDQVRAEHESETISKNYWTCPSICVRTAIISPLLSVFCGSYQNEERVKWVNRFFPPPPSRALLLRTITNIFHMYTTKRRRRDP